MSIKPVIQKAETKFGKVIAIAQIEDAPHGDFYFLLCKRNNPPCSFLLYMTITGKFDKERPANVDPIDRVTFFGGNYDLDAVKAASSFRNTTFVQ